MFIAILCALLLLLGGANVYVFVRLMQSLGWPTMCVRLVVGAALVVLSLMFVLSLMLRHSSGASTWGQTLFRVGGVWFLYVLYMIPILGLTDVVVHWAAPGFRHSVWVAAALNTALLVWGNWVHRHPQVNTIAVSLTQLSATAPRRIVAVSDVHLGPGTGRAELARYVELINSLKPDVLLICGDLVDHSVEPLCQQQMAAELCRLQAPMGIYMALGNHEYISGVRKVAHFVEHTPICLLRDSVAILPGHLAIVGRDDRLQRHRRSMAELMTQVPQGMATIVLDHQPNEIAEAQACGADILICGHTHGGQVWPITWLTQWLFAQSRGHRQWGQMHTIVSQGLSLWGPPFRLGSQGEVIVIEMNRCGEPVCGEKSGA